MLQFPASASFEKKTQLDAFIKTYLLVVVEQNRYTFVESFVL